MNKYFRLFLILLISGSPILAQAQDIVYTEASSLTLTGKLMNTPNPYHRVDTVQFKGFTKTENSQVRMSSGIGVAFRTNSPSISVVTKFGEVGFPSNTGGFSARGYDLYIKKDGKWLWAGSKAPSGKTADDPALNNPITIVDNMDGTMKECLMYFPLFSEEYSIKIGVKEGSTLEALPNPFRYRIGIFGSSFTHSSSSASDAAVTASFRITSRTCLPQQMSTPSSSIHSPILPSSRSAKGCSPSSRRSRQPIPANR